jgi:hypothetical protein
LCFVSVQTPTLECDTSDSRRGVVLPTAMGMRGPASWHLFTDPTNCKVTSAPDPCNCRGCQPHSTAAAHTLCAASAASSHWLQHMLGGMLPAQYRWWYTAHAQHIAAHAHVRSTPPQTQPAHTHPEGDNDEGVPQKNSGATPAPKMCSSTSRCCPW